MAAGTIGLVLLLLQCALSSAFVCPPAKTAPVTDRKDGQSCGGTCNAFGSCLAGLRCVPRCQLMATMGARPAGECQPNTNVVDCVDGSTGGEVAWAAARQDRPSKEGRLVLFSAAGAVGVLALAGACIMRRRAAHAGQQQRMTGEEAAQAYDEMDRAQIGNRWGSGGVAPGGFELPTRDTRDTREPQEWVDGV